jgi:hypothetical protein
MGGYRLGLTWATGRITHSNVFVPGRALPNLSASTCS